MPQSRLPRFGGSDDGGINVAHSIAAVTDVSFGLQQTQHPAYGGVRGRVGKIRPDVGYGGVFEPVENFQDLPLPAAQLHSDVFGHNLNPCLNASALAYASTLAFHRKTVKRVYITFLKALARILDVLAAAHGEIVAAWPTDPYLFLVWLHCGYPASDARCAKGWESVTSQIGAGVDRILAASPAKLTNALKAGGMVPELRAMRLKEIAERVVKQYGGDLSEGLRGLPVAEVRRSLKQFPNIADPGADRILLFAGISPVAAVPSNCPHVLVRIQAGKERENYVVTYREAQRMIENGVPATFDSRTRAYLLLKHHGQQVCKSSNPRCDSCPVAPDCAFFAGKLRGRANSVKG